MARPGIVPYQLFFFFTLFANGEFKFHLNVTSIVFFTIALLDQLEAGTDKKVINLASMLGDLTYTLANPSLHFASYSTTKAALTIATSKFHVE